MEEDQPQRKRGSSFLCVITLPDTSIFPSPQCAVIQFSSLLFQSFVRRARSFSKPNHCDQVPPAPSTFGLPPTRFFRVWIRASPNAKEMTDRDCGKGKREPKNLGTLRSPFFSSLRNFSLCKRKNNRSHFSSDIESFPNSSSKIRPPAS